LCLLPDCDLWHLCRVAGLLGDPADIPGGGGPSAAGIALIGSIGNLVGFASPSIDGWDKGATGSINAELYVIGASLTAAAIALVALRARLTHAAA